MLYLLANSMVYIPGILEEIIRMFKIKQSKVKRAQHSTGYIY